MTFLNQLNQLENDIRYRQTPPAGTHPFQIKTGRLPILLSAPHATVHIRDGKQKLEEEFTAAFVRLLSAELNTHAIHTTHKINEDPNFHADSAYKRALAAHIKQHNIQLVIDLHGMTNKNLIGVALGTMNGRSISADATTLLTPFFNQGFQEIHLSDLPNLHDQNWQRVVLNHPKFTGGLKNHTITRFVSQNLGVPALQIELTSSIRIIHRGPHDGWPFHFYGDSIGIHSAYLALKELINTIV